MTDTAAATTTAPAPAPASAPTPADATSALTPAEAATVLQQRMNDKDFVQKWLGGGSAEKSEVAALIAQKVQADRTDAALAGTLSSGEPNIGGVSPANLLASIQHFRDELGLSDGAIREALSGSPVNKETFDRAMRLRAERLSDPEWRDLWMKGGVLQRREAMLLAIIKNNGVAKEKAA